MFEINSKKGLEILEVFPLYEMSESYRDIIFFGCDKSEYTFKKIIHLYTNEDTHILVCRMDCPHTVSLAERK